jgi:hypothetical protein
MTRTLVCKCGHVKDIHQHYRPGTNCGVANCGCRYYRSKIDWASFSFWLGVGLFLIIFWWSAYLWFRR